jgi:hypothetical protein
LDIEELTGPENGDESGRHPYPAAPLIEQAMMGYGISGRGEREHRPDLDYLRARVHSAYRSYQKTRYDATGRILPRLIRDAEAPARAAGSASGSRPGRG